MTVITDQQCQFWLYFLLVWTYCETCVISQWLICISCHARTQDAARSTSTCLEIVLLKDNGGEANSINTNILQIALPRNKQYDCQLCDLSTWNPFPLMVSLHATIISPRQTRRANATATLPGAQLISQPFEKHLILTDDFRTVRSRHPNAKLQRKMPSKRCVNRACARCSWSSLLL